MGSGGRKQETCPLPSFPAAAARRVICPLLHPSTKRWEYVIATAAVPGRLFNVLYECVVAGEHLEPQLTALLTAWITAVAISQPAWNLNETPKRGRFRHINENFEPFALH